MQDLEDAVRNLGLILRSAAAYIIEAAYGFMMALRDFTHWFWKQTLAVYGHLSLLLAEIIFFLRVFWGAIVAFLLYFLTKSTYALYIGIAWIGLLVIAVIYYKLTQGRASKQINTSNTSQPGPATQSASPSNAYAVPRPTPSQSKGVKPKAIKPRNYRGYVSNVHMLPEWAIGISHVIFFLLGVWSVLRCVDALLGYGPAHNIVQVEYRAIKDWIVWLHKPITRRLH